MFLVDQVDQVPHMLKKLTDHVVNLLYPGLHHQGPHMFLVQVQQLVFYLVHHLLGPRHKFPTKQ